MMHTDLEVYKSSMMLVKEIYDLTSSFPRDEVWGLTSQMKRAVVSIPSNIAEGCGRRSSRELSNFLNVALGSLTELITQIDIALMLGFIEDKVIAQNTTGTAQRVKRQLVGLIKSVEDQA
ncbi:MAG TPA: four helix bundle protein [Candidatus Cloacimonadota bacterium]|nr:four helix bundle protein [Candidatus Cloacimonadota bacterium]HPS37902.1 four helix bundle protein [Candidatus Cloacimonadota bacterium]